MKKKERVEQEIKGAFRIAKTNKLIEAVCLVALGLVLLIWSGTALIVICKAIAAIIAIAGIVTVVTFFYRSSRVYGSSFGLFGGVVALVIGMYLFFNPEILASLGPTIIGLIVLVTGREHPDRAPEVRRCCRGSCDRRGGDCSGCDFHHSPGCDQQNPDEIHGDCLDCGRHCRYLDHASDW